MEAAALSLPSRAASAFDFVALRCQQRHDARAMVALHLYHAVFDRAARAAGGFELLAQGVQRRIIKRQAFDQRNPFARAAFGLA